MKTFWFILFFWLSEAIILSLLLFPVLRFVRFGWWIKKQEFCNRLPPELMAKYLKRFWKQTLEIRKPVTTSSASSDFDYVYDVINGQKLYRFPIALLSGAVFLFGGLVISSAIRIGYENYIQVYEKWKAVEVEVPGIVLNHLPIQSVDNVFMPFPYLMLNFPSLCAVSGAYLFVIGVVIYGYRTRTLIVSDLLWCSFRMVVSIPLGLSVAQLGASTFAPFLAFSLGAFPMEALNRLVRRISMNALNSSDNDTDNLVKMQGVTPNIAANLYGEGIQSIQQLADVDPVSLSIRSGLPFDYVMNLISQSQAWSFIGETAGKLAPLGLGDARMIAVLVESVRNNVQTDINALKAAADKVVIDFNLLLRNFRNIANDSYTEFLGKF